LAFLDHAWQKPPRHIMTRWCWKSHWWIILCMD